MEHKLRKNVHSLNLLLMLCAMISLLCYESHGGLWLKGFTSFWFVLLGFVNLLYARRRDGKASGFLVLTEAGLFLGMCADVLLGIAFMLGIVVFALGHVLYLAAFCGLKKPRWKTLLILIPIIGISLYIVTCTPYIRIQEPMLSKLSVVYAVIISCMLGKAIDNLNRSVSRWLFFLGSVLFWFSDLMLAVTLFGDGGRIADDLCSYTYWPAQNILAYAMFHHINERRKAENNEYLRF